MGHGIFGWDLPPGCRASDIPGNRPEDGKQEAIEENFYNKDRITKTPYGILITEKEYQQMDEIFKDPKISDVVSVYISAAIEYGMDIGEKETRNNIRDNKYYDLMYHEEVRNPKLRAFFKNQRMKVIALMELTKELSG